MGHNGMDTNYSMKSIHRTMQIMKAFSHERQSLSMTEFHEITGISIPSLQRILATLVYEGFLQKDEKTKKYQLGMELYLLGNLVQKHTNLLNAANPLMESIRDQINESVSLNTLFQNNKQRCIAFCKSYQELSTSADIGLTSPLYAGASGRVILAHMKEGDINKYLETTSLVQITKNTIVDKTKLLDELRMICEKGYAKSFGERVKGAFALSVPIFTSLEHVEDSLAIVMPDARIEDYHFEELIVLLKESSKKITDILNYRTEV